MKYRIHHKAVTASTNLDARAGLPGDVYTAAEQTAQHAEQAETAPLLVLLPAQKREQQRRDQRKDRRRLSLGNAAGVGDALDNCLLVAAENVGENLLAVLKIGVFQERAGIGHVRRVILQRAAQRSRSGLRAGVALHAGQQDRHACGKHVGNVVLAHLRALADRRRSVAGEQGHDRIQIEIRHSALR